MKYYLISGEASGDLHGSNLIKEIKKIDSSASIRCWGGDKMEAAGATLVKHYKELAFMGFTEVIRNLPTILKNLAFCKADIAAFKPGVVVLIDYPGFNLRMAAWLKENNYTVIYYISPQVWAWKENRVKGIKKTVDKMIVILPFEKEFYKKWNFDVAYVGHPLVEVIDQYKIENPPAAGQASNNIIAILPGSRKQEIEKKLPVMLSVMKHFPGYRFILAQAPGLEDEFYLSYLTTYPRVEIYQDKTYSLLAIARAALVTSGTATLETALFRVPEIICYKGNPVSYRIARWLIKIKFIGLVNLIMDKAVVKELIQQDLTTENLVKELKYILEDGPGRTKILKDYDDLYTLLSAGGKASEKAAEIVVAAARH
ncbi:MAG: lipid-A-disaccharide synthase [Ferruginibacter sp.]